jgi:hypothetical protein
MTEHVYSNWKPKHLDISVVVEVEWFSKDSLINVLDSVIPVGSPDFIDGWESLAGYLRLEFSK